MESAHRHCTHRCQSEFHKHPDSAATSLTGSCFWDESSTEHPLWRPSPHRLDPWCSLTLSLASLVTKPLQESHSKGPSRCQPLGLEPCKPTTWTVTFPWACRRTASDRLTPLTKSSPSNPVIGPNEPPSLPHPKSLHGALPQKLPTQPGNGLQRQGTGSSSAHKVAPDLLE